MPNISTHAKIIKEVYSKNKKFNLDYLVSGSIFPDYYYFLKYQKYNDPTNLLHSKLAKRYSEKLIKSAKNKKELSFAIGVYSHIIVDQKVHAYLRKNKLEKNINHLVIEHFLEIKQHTPVNKILICKNLIKRTIPKKYYIHLKKINLFNSIKFILFNKTIFFLIKQKYINKKRSKKKSIWNLILRIGYKRPLKRVEFTDIEKIVNPNFKLKKHIKNIEKEINLSKKEIIKKIKELI
ncbi:MAG: zinc dependent phospholipase C family protein [Candidatus ainarchaeum sp.]|nr:zinc dependent phospholipase C family protein [Candidatus ainarchaeum sp.]MDD3975687.1 zinc dependent phospholipase C family protein [Candidatus ainarchaeum sp.]